MPSETCRAQAGGNRAGYSQDDTSMSQETSSSQASRPAILVSGSSPLAPMPNSGVLAICSHMIFGDSPKGWDAP